MAIIFKTRDKINAKIYKEDNTGESGYLGVKFPMNAQTSNRSRGLLFDVSYTTEEQAISNYINLLFTKQGERYMHPNYGVGIWYYVFEQNSIAMRTELQSIIQEQASRYLPYIINDRIEVFATDNDADQNRLNIQIDFRVTEQGANRTVVIFQDSSGNGVVELN